MAIQTLELDPNAAPQPTGDEIITAINSASSAISRSDSLDFEALKIVVTNPTTGEFRVIALRKQASGNKLLVDYDDVPMP